MVSECNTFEISDTCNREENEGLIPPPDFLPKEIPNEEHPEILEKEDVIDDSCNFLNREQHNALNKENEQVLKTTKASKLELFAIGFLFVCESYNFTFLFPFIGQFVLHYGMVEKDTETGYYASVIAGCYSLSQFISSFIFGFASDTFCKKKVMIVSMAMVIIANFAFPFAPTFWSAVAIRAFCGGFNGSVATAKSYITNIVDESNQSVSWSVIGFAWGFGSVIGPMISGVFAKPAQKYPQIFSENGFFAKYPYSISSFLCASFYLLGIIIVFLGLKSQNSAESASLNVGYAITEGDGNKMEKVTIPKKSLHLFFLNKASMYRNIISLEVCLSILIYFFACIIEVMHDELFPLWSFLDIDSGGLKLGTTQIGIVQAIYGFCYIVLQLLLFPPFSKRFGPLNTLKIGFIMVLPLTLVPQIQLLLFISPLLAWIGLIAYCIVRTIFGIFAFTAVFIAISNSAPIGKAGTVQGFSQSMGNLARTIGPFIAGPILAWCSTLSWIPLAIRLNIPFVLVSIAAVMALLSSCFLTSNINHPKKKSEYIDTCSHQELHSKQDIELQIV